MGYRNAERRTNDFKRSDVGLGRRLRGSRMDWRSFEEELYDYVPRESSHGDSTVRMSLCYSRIERRRTLGAGLVFIVIAISTGLHLCDQFGAACVGLWTALALCVGYLVWRTVDCVQAWWLQREADELFRDIPDSSGAPFDSGAYPPA